MSRYAIGAKAIGDCDRCGFQYLLHDLKAEVVDQNKTGFLVCPTCWDPDQPQYQLGKIPFDDIQAIKNPRPPQGLTQSRYGDSIRYDFLTSVDSWAAANSSISVSHNATEEALVFSDVDTSAIHAVGHTGLSIDTSAETGYTKARILFSITTRPSPSSWVGKMYWNSLAKVTRIESPDFETMGDTKHVLTWDLFGNSDWTGTVTDVTFEFFDQATVGGSYQLDYIRFEKS